MAQQPMTPAGVTAKQAELNALSQQDLQAQANLIRSNFASWIVDNFTLTTDQQTYLSGISSEFMAYAAPVTAFAVENHLTIALSVSGNQGGNGVFKLIHINNAIVVNYDPNNGFSTSGTLTYEFDYQSQ